MPLLGTGPRVVRGQTATGESIALLAAFAVRHVLAAVASRVPPAAADGGHKRTDAINSLHLIPASQWASYERFPKPGKEMPSPDPNALAQAGEAVSNSASASRAGRYASPARRNFTFIKLFPKENQLGRLSTALAQTRTIASPLCRLLAPILSGRGSGSFPGDQRGVGSEAMPLCHARKCSLPRPARGPQGRM